MVWKKTSSDSERPERPVLETPPAAVKAEPVAPPAARRPATIGPSISIEGDVAGKEDLRIEGHLTGTVSVPGNAVTVVRGGQVQADVFGKTVEVEGEVQGDLFGLEEIVIRREGRVEGNLTAPRVTLEDGSVFRGSIDMSAPPQADASEQPEAKPKAKEPEKEKEPERHEAQSEQASG